MTNYDVIVIGGGAAGLSAALLLSRARRRVVVVDAGAPRNAPAGHVHGFLSRDGITPSDLLAAGRQEVARYGGAFHNGTAIDAVRGPGGLRVQLNDGTEFTARRLLVATGLHDELPDIPGLRERWGRDVLHCPYCHGFEVRDDAVGVLGGAPMSVHQAHLIRQIASDVVYFTHTGELSPLEREQFDARGISIVDQVVTGLVVDDGRLAGVRVSDGSVVDREALFVSPRFIANSDLLSQLGCVFDDERRPVVDASGRSSVAGVWVAGNVANARAQVVTAAGEGSAAAIAVNADLLSEDVTRAGAHPTTSISGR
jgi:thioredoxin reductase